MPPVGRVRNREGGLGLVFGGKKKLYREGTRAEGQVVGLTSYGVHGEGSGFGVKVRVKFPDGSMTEFEKGPLSAGDVGQLYEGSVVPVRYDPANHSKVALDIPALEESQAQAKGAQQAQLDAQFAQMGEPGSPAAGAPAAQVLAGLGAGGDLKAKLLQMAAENPGSVIDLRSSQPQAAQVSDPVDRLAKLADLRERGVLTDAEFEAEKAKVLGES